MIIDVIYRCVKEIQEEIFMPCCSGSYNSEKPVRRLTIIFFVTHTKFFVIFLLVIVLYSSFTGCELKADKDYHFKVDNDENEHQLSLRTVLKLCKKPFLISVP